MLERYFNDRGLLASALSLMNGEYVSEVRPSHPIMAIFGEALNGGIESYYSFVQQNNINSFEELLKHFGITFLDNFSRVDMYEVIVKYLNENTEVGDKFVSMIDSKPLYKNVESGYGIINSRIDEVKVVSKKISVALLPIGADFERALSLTPWFDLEFSHRYTYYPKSDSYNSQKVRDYSKWKNIKDTYYASNITISGLWGEGAYHKFPIKRDFISEKHIVYVPKGCEELVENFLIEGVNKLAEKGYSSTNYANALRIDREVESRNY